MAFTNNYIRGITGPTLLSGGLELPLYSTWDYNDAQFTIVPDPTVPKYTFKINPIHVNHSYISGTLTSNLKNLTGSADNPTMICQGMSSSLDGGEGIFFYISGSTATIDDGLIFGNPSLTGRWFRIYDTNGPISVAWWGPVTAAKITTAISAAHVMGGANVIVPQDNYNFTGIGSDRINLLSNVNLHFAPGTTIAVADPVSSISKIINIDSTNADMQNIKVFGNGLTINFTRSNNYVLQQGVVINSQFSYRTVDNIEINDIKIVSSSMDGVVVGGNADCVTSNIRFNRITAVCCKRAGGTLIGSNDVVYTDCHFDWNGKGNEPQNGFDIEVNTGLDNINAKFVRCTFNYNTNHGCYNQNPIYGITNRVTYDNCDFNYNGFGTVSASYGIVSSVTQTTITNCRARKNNAGGFYANGDTIFDKCFAQDNGLSGFTGITANGPVTFTNCVSKFNQVDGFRVNSFGTDKAVNSVINCEAFGNQQCGITLTSARNCRIFGNNVIGNFEDGIKVVTSEQNVINNNNIMSNGQTSDNAADNIIVQTRSHLNSFFGNHIRQSPNFYDTYVSASTFTTGNNVQFSGSQYNKNDGIYNGMYARIVAGTENGAGGIVTAFTGSTGIATVNWSPALGGALDATSRIQLVGTRAFYGAVQSGSTTGVQISTEIASQIDDAYVPGTLHIYSGTTILQSTTISAYDGDTGFVTTTDALSPAPAANTVVEIWFYNRPRYGLRVDTTSHQNNVIGNDLYLAGANTAYSSGVTTTNITTLNRTS